jgi:hypothetical protein
MSATLVAPAGVMSGPPYEVGEGVALRVNCEWTVGGLIPFLDGAWRAQVVLKLVRAGAEAATDLEYSNTTPIVSGQTTYELGVDIPPIVLATEEHERLFEAVALLTARSAAGTLYPLGGMAHLGLIAVRTEQATCDPVAIAAEQATRDPVAIATSIADRTYLVEGYARLASGGLLEPTSEDPKSVQATLSSLCRDLDQLSNDHRFWADLVDLVGGPNKDLVTEWSDGLDDYLDEHVDELRGLGHDDEVIDLLLNDASLALDLLGRQPSGTSYQNLRLRLTALRDAACAASEGQAERSRAWARRSRRILRHGGWVLAGGSIIVLDSKAYLVHGRPEWLQKSVDVGLSVIARTADLH